jgi:murein DD-endopeptidase MepM/ murein hydrolase activator NlpD
VAAFCGSALAAMAIGYLLATSYLVLRDDLIGATTSRQARMQQAYEDRISALRAQVDRITSRQLLDQQLMETKVGELLERQSQLSLRHGRLAPILERAGSDVGTTPAAGAAASAKPDQRADATDAQPQVYSVASVGALGTSNIKPFSLWSTRSDPAPSDTAADRADKLFVSINESLQAIESQQLTRIAALADNAFRNADAISQALESAGLPVDSDFGKSDTGGPLIPLDSSMVFDSKVRELDEALDALDRLKTEARRLPLANPAPGRSVTSPFGVRTDPLLGTAALHSGMDFRAPTGMPAKVTAHGVVVKAGWNGGYGRMVEVDHGNGFTTRYGHLSKISVTVGERLDAGDVVGKTGSSGRSTGPHLHYEIRHNGEAIDPLRFLRVGKKVAQYL